MNGVYQALVNTVILFRHEQPVDLPDRARDDSLAELFLKLLIGTYAKKALLLLLVWLFDVLV